MTKANNLQKKERYYFIYEREETSKGKKYYQWHY